MRQPFLISLSAFLVSSAASAQMNAKDLKWGPPPPGLPAGSELAVLSGDPSKAGMFTIRARMPAGYTIPPHQHPSDELVTVIEGELSLGMGDTLDKAKAATLTEAGYVAMPAKMNHYAFTTSGATIQITSNGPFAITYVNPKDDPRNAAAPEKGAR